MSKLKAYCQYFYLLLFIFLTLFINFFHTEKIVADFHQKQETHTHAPPKSHLADRNCPACHFLNTSYSTPRILPFILHPPPISRDLPRIDIVHHQQLFTVLPSARSPPAA